MFIVSPANVDKSAPAEPGIEKAKKWNDKLTARVHVINVAKRHA